MRYGAILASNLGRSARFAGTGQSSSDGPRHVEGACRHTSSVSAGRPSCGGRLTAVGLRTKGNYCIAPTESRSGHKLRERQASACSVRALPEQNNSSLVPRNAQAPSQVEA